VLNTPFKGPSFDLVIVIIAAGVMNDVVHYPQLFEAVHPLPHQWANIRRAH
jgi:hypothetical protein